MSGHGGARAGAGRPAVAIDERRVMALVSQGFSRVEIGKRFDVPVWVIRRVVQQERKK
jgi:transposase